MSSIRSMMGGGGHQSSFGDQAGLGGGNSSKPWSSDQSNSDLARDAGINDIGSGGHRAEDSSRAGFFDPRRTTTTTTTTWIWIRTTSAVSGDSDYA